METIKTYLDNMFSAYPDSPEIRKIRRDLLENLLDKYAELKAAGKSENEAVGIVISEFGNIEELVGEMGLRQNRTDAQRQPTEEPTPYLDTDTVEDFLREKKRAARGTGIGVAIILVGVAVLMFSLAHFDNNGVMGIIPMLILIAGGVGVIIATNYRSEQYDDLEAPFTMDAHMKEELSRQYDHSSSKWIATIVGGVVLIIVSSVAVILPAILYDGKTVLYGVAVMMLVVAAALQLLIPSAMMQDAYNMLLGKEEYAVRHKSDTKAEQIIGAIAGAYWPLVVCLYLLISFLSGAWHISWLVWPIAGVLFGGVSALISNVYAIKD